MLVILSELHGLSVKRTPVKPKPKYVYRLKGIAGNGGAFRV